MPVTRCGTCRRGLAGYLECEKKLSDLTTGEIRTEISKYEAKGVRIKDYLTGLRDGTIIQQIFLEGIACPDCQLGWRQFEKGRKDLEQLTIAQAKAALAANTRSLKRLLDRLP